MLEARLAVTFVTRNEAFWPVQNALVIVDASSESPMILPRVDACYRSAVPLVLNQAQEASFLTLLPGVPHVIVQSFRPFGPEVFDAAKIVAMGAARYRLAGKFGMQQLTVGREYLLTVEQELLIVNWMLGTKEMLLAVEGNEPNPVHIEGEPIPVIASGQAKFRIEP